MGDLEQLINKKFILVRDENLILIKGWRINNTIQPSRLIETKFTNDLSKLYLDENNSYTENITNKPALDVCQQNVDNVSTQYNLIKFNLSKYNLSQYNINNNILELLNNNLGTNLNELDYKDILEYINNISTKYSVNDILDSIKDYLHTYNKISNFNSLHSHMTKFLSDKELF